MAQPQSNLPDRSRTYSDEEAVPDTAPGDTVGLLSERLRAWKHMCGYLEEYIKAVSHEQKSNGKDQEKVLKAVSKPLREGQHFDQALGGISGLFENIRSNTSAVANMHYETAKNLDGTVLPMLERLHHEIKNKDKELAKGAGQGSKVVAKAQNESQKHIELLGTHTANFDSSGARHTAQTDPYVLNRGVHHRLNKQLIEESNNRNDIIAVQNSFKDFEAHVLAQVQAALNSFQQFMGSQADRQKAIYGDISGVAGHIPPDFEWNGFLKRNEHMLVDPSKAPRTMANVSFPNQGHRSTKALIEGSLERKSRAGVLKGYSAGYYAVSPAGFLHEYKDNDDFRKDPSPEISLYLPDCVIGAVSDTKFTIKGKDASKGSVGSKFAQTHDFQFKAHTSSDAQQWHQIIAQKAQGGGALPTDTAANSPITTKSQGESQLPPTAAEKEAMQARGEEAASPTTGQQAGTISQSSKAANDAHYHGQPNSQPLSERQYVEKQV